MNIFNYASKDYIISYILFKYSIWLNTFIHHFWNKWFEKWIKVNRDNVNKYVVKIWYQRLKIYFDYTERISWNITSFPFRSDFQFLELPYRRSLPICLLDFGVWLSSSNLRSRIASTHTDTYIHNRCTRQLLWDLIDELVITSSTRDGQGTERKADAIGETRNADEKQTRRKNMEQKEKKVERR